MKRTATLLLSLVLTLGISFSQDTRTHLTFFGSSVCKGTGAKDQKGYAWQFYHSGSLDTAKYAYFNASTGGDNTLKVEKLDRLTKNLYPTNPHIVVIGLSLGNEGIRTPKTDAGRRRIVEQYRSRLLALADSLARQGIQPVIMNCYAHSYFYEEEYAATKHMNQFINAWPYPSVNVLGAIDDGKGRWVEGFVNDPWHPNTEGHEEMYLTIVPSLFDALMQGKKTPSYDWNKSFTRMVNENREDALTFEVDDKMHSFAMSFRFKEASNGVLAKVETDQGTREIIIDDYNIFYGDKRTTFPKHTGAWNQVVLTHNYAKQRTLFALNGEVIAEVDERLVPQKFVYGGQLEKVDMKDIMLHRSSLHEDEIRDLSDKLFIQSSLEIYSPLTREIKGDNIRNRAQSLSKLKRAKGLKLEWIEKPLY